MQKPCSASMLAANSHTFMNSRSVMTKMGENKIDGDKADTISSEWAYCDAG